MQDDVHDINTVPTYRVRSRFFLIRLFLSCRVYTVCISVARLVIRARIVTTIIILAPRQHHHQSRASSWPRTCMQIASTGGRAPVAKNIRRTPVPSFTKYTPSRALYNVFGFDPRLHRYPGIFLLNILSSNL